MSGDKNKPASKQKLLKSRRDGSIPRNPDAASLTGTVGAILLLFWGSRVVLSNFNEVLGLAASSYDFSLEAASSRVVRKIGDHLMSLFLPFVGVVVGLSILVSVGSQRGLVFSVKAILPDLHRLSPLTGLKQIFGIRGLAKAVQGLARLVIWFIGAGIVLFGSLQLMLEMGPCGAACAAQVSVRILGQLAIFAGAVMLVAAAVDLKVQNLIFLKEQRMSETEVRQETKEQFGSPEIRRARRSQRQAQGGDAIGATKATMCFYDQDACVALRYHPKFAPLPRVSAVSFTADRSTEIRNKVRQNGFPERKHPALVSALNRLVPGEAIEEAHFEILALAMRDLYATKTI